MTPDPTQSEQKQEQAGYEGRMHLGGAWLLVLSLLTAPIVLALGVVPLALGAGIEVLLVAMPCFLLTVLLGSAGVLLLRTAKRRARSGRCPMCDYDLRACPEPGCPECGWRRG